MRLRLLPTAESNEIQSRNLFRIVVLLPERNSRLHFRLRSNLDVYFLPSALPGKKDRVEPRDQTASPRPSQTTPHHHREYPKE